MERLKTGGVAKFDVKKDRYRLCQPGHWQDEHLLGIMGPASITPKYKNLH